MGEKQGRRNVLAAERWEPYEARVSRTVLRGPGGEIPPGYSLSRRRSCILLASAFPKMRAAIHANVLLMLKRIDAVRAIVNHYLCAN